MATGRPTEPFDPLEYGNIARSVVNALLDQAVSPLKGIGRFRGAGIYALYYTGPFVAYQKIATRDYATPIYVGKAVPAGSRKGMSAGGSTVGPVLHRRLMEHAASIEQAANLQVSDFTCRYLLVLDVWIPLAERVLVRRFRPLWNTVIDGFGNHPPGRGRRDMRRPRWDVVHPGREWATRLEARESIETILTDVEAHLGQRPG